MDAGSIDGFKKQIEMCMREFVSNQDLNEAARCIAELNSPQLHYLVVKRAVTLAMDWGVKEREMVFVFLATLHVKTILASHEMAAGLFTLIEALPDLTIDCPQAIEILARFISDAVLDELITFEHIEEWSSSAKSTPEAAAALELVYDQLRGKVLLGSRASALKELRGRIRAVLEEYLSSRDAAEVGRRLVEIEIPVDLRHEFVRSALELALDRSDAERELLSQLLSDLRGKELRAHEIARGFEHVIERVDDLALDYPQASDHLAAFLVRAVNDDVLPPAFCLCDMPEALTSELQKKTLKQARAAISAEHFSERKRKVWKTGVDASVQQLKEMVAELLLEFLNSAELEEAVLCIRELGAPSFHHECVKRAFVLALDGGEREQALARLLIEKLAADELLTPDQLAQGCSRLLESIADLTLDNPRAPELLADFIEHSVHVAQLQPADSWMASSEKLRLGDLAEIGALHLSGAEYPK